MIMKVRNVTCSEIFGAFIMYYMYVMSGPSLLVESTNSMIKHVVYVSQLGRLSTVLSHHSGFNVKYCILQVHVN